MVYTRESSVMLYGLFRDCYTKSVTFCKSFVKLFNWKKTKSKSPLISLSLSFKCWFFFHRRRRYISPIVVIFSVFFEVLFLWLNLIFTVIFECIQFRFFIIIIAILIR